MKKIICVLLLISIVTLSFASCDNNAATSTPGESNTASDAVSTEESKEPEKWKYDPNIPEDFDGNDEDFVFFVVGGNDEAYHSVEIGASEFNNELINDAVYTRNLFVEDELNIKIVCEYSMTVPADARIAIGSDLDTYDVIMPFMNEIPSLATDGYIEELHNIETLQLEREWWDQKANEQLSIGHKLFFTTGDISMLDNDCTQAIMFSQDVVKNFELENPYTLVKDGTWTIDNMQKLAKQATQDNAAAYTDQWGLHINGNGATGLYISSGCNLIAKDPNTDLPIIGITGEAAANAVERIRTLMTDKSSTIIIEDYNAASMSDGFVNCYRAAAWAIAEGKALFRYMSMSDTLRLSDYKLCNYGILPSPKLDDDQDSYASLVSTLAVPGVCVPTTNDDYDRIGIVLDAMSAKAKEVVTYAYYDTLYQYRIAPDKESQEILDIILAERMFDLGVIFNWSNCRTIVNSAASSASSTWTSTVDSAVTAIQTAMDKDIEAFSKLD